MKLWSDISLNNKVISFLNRALFVASIALIVRCCHQLLLRNIVSSCPGDMAKSKLPPEASGALGQVDSVLMDQTAINDSCRVLARYLSQFDGRVGWWYYVTTTENDCPLE